MVMAPTGPKSMSGFFMPGLSAQGASGDGSDSAFYVASETHIRVEDSLPSV